jgi:hypothetical protein
MQGSTVSLHEGVSKKVCLDVLGKSFPASVVKKGGVYEIVVRGMRVRGFSLAHATDNAAHALVYSLDFENKCEQKQE